jgi:plastocyanin
MQPLCVAAVGLILGLSVACADPVSNSQAQQDALSQTALTDRDRHDDDDGEQHGEQNGNPEIEVYDDCNPNDPGWAATGGCTLAGGRVTVDEFDLLLASPLSASVVGHPAWRNQPSYLKVVVGTDVHVENEGGRFHTFTKVAQFGGGRVPPLNQGLTMAPECALAPGAVDPNGLTPGAALTVSGLGRGNHRYQCCIHPWMRALVKVHR